MMMSGSPNPKMSHPTDLGKYLDMVVWTARVLPWTGERQGCWSHSPPLEYPAIKSQFDLEAELNEQKKQTNDFQNKWMWCLMMLIGI